jgi:anti-anti-sigma regulatory factor
MSWRMTFRIETAARGKFTVLILSGRIETQAITELKRLFELHTNHTNFVLDLRDVSAVDRDAMSFFARCEADGMALENCTQYIRAWMEREKD